ncbi:MAG: peptide-methionine (S)-S-oxide reductase MsrA [bacterium]|nr:peptide-methionine (S)-S-oxide reductase MsrA [bacterium]
MLTTGSARKSNKVDTATFGAGCFWGVEADFDKIPGVISTEVGYSGGTADNPTYEQVCGGDTGHAESVKVEYDPSVVPYEKLLEEFWGMHDPTTADRQGPDVGSQYRSVIFYHTPEQKESAEKSREEMDASGKFDGPIVTQIVPAVPFYPAEEYHQKYFEKTGKKVC